MCFHTSRTDVVCVAKIPLIWLHEESPKHRLDPAMGLYGGIGRLFDIYGVVSFSPEISCVSLYHM